MAIYRTQGRRPLVVAAAACLVVGLVAGVALGRLTAPGTAESLGALRGQLSRVAASLEVTRVEYPKLLSGDPDEGGAELAVTRASSQLDSAARELSLIDPAATDAARAAMTDLAQAVAARAPAAEVERGIDDVLGRIAAILPPR